ncbi:MAG: hypothetical protein J5761_06055 [Paludibacteraceae bacterium]|nr:hypothetical protein [Paludibacteraceae bacterium]
MKRLFITVIACWLTAVVMAVSVNDVTGVFRGNLNIGGTPYSNKEVYILPGTENNTITFVLPDFKYNNAPLGDIVLVNIPMSASGQLTLENRQLYIRAIHERAVIDVINGLVDGNTTYNSIVSAGSAQVLLSIQAPSVAEPILVLFNGNKMTDKNYAITNGGFEGNWSNNEVNGWHSFASATGSLSSMVTASQFKQSSNVRPGATGHSGLMTSSMTAGVKANGNCTNGQINAGSMTPDDASGNYNFSDPSNNSYNTPFAGQPDSIVFWTRYVPADRNPSNSVNKARMHTVVTTNARYQDPEAKDYSAVKIADAAINYSTDAGMSWQRKSVAFNYTGVDVSKTAYVLITFTSNMTPGGGSTYSTGSLFNKTYYYDSVYIDDVEMIYNHALSSLTLDGAAVSFTNGQAVSSRVFSDSQYTIAANTNGKASKSFIGYDADNNRVHVYVVADNYSQAGAYSLYTLQMATPVLDTEYAYSASTCDNEPYSDELFQNLTQAGVYTKTIPNTQGGDSLITLTLTILPTYSTATVDSILMDENYTWQGREYRNLAPGMYPDTLTLKTVAGCDSLFTLMLKVKPIAYQFSDSATACLNEETTWHGKALPTGETGIYRVYDSLQTAYGTDSIYELKLTVLPTYLFSETRYVNEADLVWRGKTIQGLPQAQDPYMIYDSLVAVNGCDSVYMLRLFVSDLPVTYGFYEAAICQGEFVKYEGVKYTEAFEGDIHVSAPNVYGGDSIVHLTVVILPTYTIDEYQTITVGDDITWEGWNLSTMPEGKMTLNASYYTIDDCDSTLVLHLTVIPETEQTALDEIKENGRENEWLRVIHDGQLFIIRKEEMYNILGTKIQ